MSSLSGSVTKVQMARNPTENKWYTPKLPVGAGLTERIFV